MRDEQSILDVLDQAAKRRDARRDFLRTAGMATVAAGGMSLLAACDDDDNNTGGTPTPTPSPTATAAPVTDADILNFALQLEYLEAQYYAYALTGSGLAANLQTGTGTQGAVSISGPNPPRAVNFAGETLIGQYAREIAADEIAHVAFLRAAITSPVAQPAINISGDAAGAFTAVARAAGVVGPTAIFDPYSSPDFFLIGAYIFEDVGVTAYKGAAPLLSSAVFLEAAAGILAAEAYHAGLVRTVLYSRGQSAGSLITIAQQVSDLRDTVDGTPTENALRGIGPDDDQGITPSGSGATAVSNLVPTNTNGLAYSRTPQQVLNIVYGTRMSVSAGAFFPSGLNGLFRTSAAN